VSHVLALIVLVGLIFKLEDVDSLLDDVVFFEDVVATLWFCELLEFLDEADFGLEKNTTGPER